MSKIITSACILLSCFALPAFGQDSVWCSGSWKQGVIGRNVGYNTMNVTDIDGDGVDEIVTHGHVYSSYWYVMEYSPGTGGYEQTWISQAYPQNSINCMEVFDPDNDGNMEVVVAQANGVIETWDGATLTMEHSFILPIPEGDWSEPMDMLVADADNDGSDELVISTYSSIFIYDAVTLNYETAWPYGGYNIACGNIDSNPDNELVVSTGSVIRLKDNELTLIWKFADSDYGFEWTGMIDCDGDGMQEVFYETTEDLIAYDADLQQVKYQIPDEGNSISFTITDTDDNGTLEILRGEFSFGNISCIDPADGSEVWSFYKEGENVNSIAIADVDQDGIQEIVWTEQSFIHVYGMETLEEEWVNKDIDGPFTVRVADVDDDGETEILSFSQSSDDHYSSGILTIWNESTREIEWQSDALTFDYSLTDVLDFEVTDIDNDGVTEIIVAGTVWYNGWIWVMNGQTHAIESSHEFNINGFYGIDVADVDNNGTVEYICFTGSAIYAVNPGDYSILWQKHVLSSGGSYMLTGNTDSDPAKEIIVWGWGEIGIVDGITHDVILSTDSPNPAFSAVTLCDVDDDGENEVLGGTIDGKIAVLDGATLEFIEWLPFDFGENYNILGLVATDFENDGVPDLVFTCGDILYFSDLTGFMNTFSKIGLIISGNHPLTVTDDYDLDGKKEIFASSEHNLAEFRYDCYICRNFNGLVKGEDISCISDNDGSATIEITGGTPPYNYIWNTGSTASTISNLTPGTYSVTATDALGCTADRETVLIKSFLEVLTTVLPRGCEDQYGEISLTITEGHPPYDFAWNGISDTTSILTGLEPGSYSVYITDNKQCTTDLTMIVPQDSVDLELVVSPITCFWQGEIFSIVTGLPPYSYQWSNGSTNPNLFNLGEGIYTLSVTDALGCSDTATGIVVNADNLNATFLTTQDNPETPQGEGSITIMPSGGVPPYAYYNGYLLTDSIITGLSAKDYYIRVVDKYSCNFDAVVTIHSITGLSEPDTPSYTVYPNPASDHFCIEFNKSDPAGKTVKAELYTSQNTLVRSYLLEGKRTTIPTGGLKTGIYFLKLYLEDGVAVVKIFKG